MKRKFVLSTALGLLFSLQAFALPSGNMAPNFKLDGADGKQYSLADFKGKIVVLEWTNRGCPFVKKHYDSGNMQSLQKEFTDKGIVWLTIISSAPGKEGYATPSEALATVKELNASPTAVLLDPEGAVGKMFEAKTTPHMYVIDKSGKLAYQGAIDDKASTKIPDVKGARNYVREALGDTLAGKPVKLAFTQAYGCSVKYK